MKDRLKKKLKVKKLREDSKHNFSSLKLQQVKRKIAEMPGELREHLEKLSRTIDEGEDYVRVIPTAPPDIRAAVLPQIRLFDKLIENLKQKLVDEYEAFLVKPLRIDDDGVNEARAAAKLWELLERMFLVARHKFEPKTFKKFETKIKKILAPDDFAVFHDRAAARASYDLENILKDPDGKIRQPMKHPQTQMHETMFDIHRIVYHTDDFFRTAEAAYEHALATRHTAADYLWLLKPGERQKKQRELVELDSLLDAGKANLMVYLEAYLSEFGKPEFADSDRERREKAFAAAAVAHERMFIMYKHTIPQLFKGFVPIATSSFSTPEELDAFYERIAEREAAELDEILKSCGVGGKS